MDLSKPQKFSQFNLNYRDVMGSHRSLDNYRILLANDMWFQTAHITLDILHQQSDDVHLMGKLMWTGHRHGTILHHYTEYLESLHCQTMQTVHTYMHNFSLQPFSQDQNLTSPHHLCCVCQFHTWVARPAVQSRFRSTYFKVTFSC